jgi:hypothetical protein
MADISAATWNQSDDANNSAAPEGAPEGMASAGVNNTMRMMMGATKRFYDHVNATVTSAGTANAQTLTYDVAPAAYVAGDRYTFIAGLTNTGATTLEVDPLGAREIQNTGMGLVGGEIRQSQVIDVIYDGTRFQLIRPVRARLIAATPPDPTGTSSATAVMMGLGVAITPNVSGDLHISVVGDIGSTSTASDTTIQIRAGTGTAPANGAALTGSAVGSAVQWVTSNGALGDRIPFSLSGLLTGASVGVAYWVDIALSSSIGTATLKNLSVVIRESSR